MKVVECICPKCNKQFFKPKNEYDRRIKLNRKVFCGRSCAGTYNLRNFADKVNKNPPKNFREKNPFLYYFRNCKARDFMIDIDVEYLKSLWEKQKGICPYTGLELKLNCHQFRHKDKRYVASLDRIDPNKGYIKGNVQFISLAINLMKNTMSHEETIEFLQIIAKKYT